MGKLEETYKKYVPSPLLQHIGAGAIGTLGAALLYSPAIDTLEGFARPLAATANGGTVPRAFDRRMDKLRSSSGWRWGLAAAAGLLSAGASIALTYRGNEKNKGLLKWTDSIDKSYYADKHDPTDDVIFKHGLGNALTKSLLNKNSSLRKMASLLNDPFTVDYANQINRNQMCNMIKNDPYLYQNPYARNMATASLMNARPVAGSSCMTTLGAIHDSTMNKLNKSLTFGGVVNTAARSMLANQGAKLFTATVGTMMGLPDRAKRNIMSAGTLAGAISSIF